MLARLVLFLLVFAFVGPARNAQISQTCGFAYFIPADTVITLAENGCVVKITSDGTVVFEGEAFDFDISRVRMKISAEELKTLICEFERIKYFSLNDSYRREADGCPVTGTDCSSIAIRTSITLNGKSKSVTHHQYACLERDGSPYPRELTALEKRIETVVDLKRR